MCALTRWISVYFYTNSTYVFSDLGVNCPVHFVASATTDLCMNVFFDRSLNWVVE